jgi:hypothetical protein
MKYKISDKLPVSDFLPDEYDDEIFKGYEEQIHLQIIYLPDVEYLNGDIDPYVLVERKPEEIRKKSNKKYAISEIKEIYGNYIRSKVISEALLLNNQASFPIHEYCFVLRPEGFEKDKHWLNCPECENNSSINTELKVQTGDKKLDFKIECDECKSFVRNESDNRENISKWVGCPICRSTNIKYECSLPYGFVNFSCDNCDYNTKPCKTDTGFSEINFQID